MNTNISSTSLRTDRIEHHLSDQTLSLRTIEQGIQNLSHSQQAQTEPTELLIISRQTVNLLVGVDQKLDKVLHADQNQHENELRVIPRSRSRKSNQTKISVWCTCRTRRTIHWTIDIGGFLTVDALHETEHEHGCRSYRSGNYKFSYTASNRRPTRFLPFCIQAAFSYGRAAGHFVIQPSLSVRRVVPKSSPAFAAFDNLPHAPGCKFRLHWRFICRCRTRQHTSHVLRTVFERVLNSFRDGLASPFDELPNGDTTIDVSVLAYVNIGFADLDITQLAYSMCIEMVLGKQFSAQMACELLSDFINAGQFQLQGSVIPKTVVVELIGMQ